MTTPDPSRAAFEQWYSTAGENSRSVERQEDGRYIYVPTEVCWVAWQAAMAHKARREIKATKAFRVFKVQKVIRATKGQPAQKVTVAIKEIPEPLARADLSGIPDQGRRAR